MIKAVGPKEFAAAFGNVPHVYNSVAFAEHNRAKCDDSDVRYLLAADSKVRAGIVVGRRDGVLRSPFSAPFGGLTVNRDQQLDVLESVWHNIADYAAAEGLALRITLPPTIYDTPTTVKSADILSRLGLVLSTDLNYHICLGRGDFADVVSRTGRNKLRQALANGFIFMRMTPDDASITRFYRVIESNHTSKGRPMSMSLSDVLSTARLVGADFFMLTYDGADVAAAMVYPAADGIVQVINWGDVPGYEHLRPMNMLPCCIYDHYSSIGLRVLDLGPASSAPGVPDVGLSVYKESLGAVPSLKFTFATAK